jgi:hypothetical protein
MRAELLARFESEIKALEEWLGRRIPAWRM